MIMLGRDTFMFHIERCRVPPRTSCITFLAMSGAAAPCLAPGVELDLDDREAAGQPVCTQNLHNQFTCHRDPKHTSAN